MLRYLKQPQGDNRASRILRGFWRLAAVVTAIAASCGLVATIIGTFSTYESMNRELDTIACLKGKPTQELRVEEYSANRIDNSKSGCPGYAYVTLDELKRFDPSQPSSAIQEAGVVLGGGLAATVLGSALIFCFVFALGWMLAGFF